MRALINFPWLQDIADGLSIVGQTQCVNLWHAISSVRFPDAPCTWSCWSALKCKIFFWLALQYRLWTSDRRVRHGLQNQVPACYVCLQGEDTVDHILVQTCSAWWPVRGRRQGGPYTSAVHGGQGELDTVAELHGGHCPPPTLLCKDVLHFCITIIKDISEV